MSNWFPLSTERKVRPEVGDVLAIEYRAWLVQRVDDTLMDSEEIAALERRYRPGYRDQYKPYRMSLQRLYGPVHDVENDRQELAFSVSMGSFRDWRVYPEGRVPLCSCCSHPWPCLMVTAAKDAERQGEMLDKKMSAAQPGCCYSCGEVISHRQKSVVYPEPNVELPGFPAPAFHLRWSCSGPRSEYDKKRALAYPDASPVVLEDQTGKLL